MRAYQQGSYSAFVETDTSVHTRKINYQPFEFCQFILTGLQQLTTQSCLIAITIVAILLYNAQLFLLLLAILLPPVILVFYLIKKRLHKARKVIQESNEHSFQHLFDALKGYMESNVYGKNDFFLKRFLLARTRFSNALFDSLAIQNMPSRIIEIFAILGLFILIVIATWLNKENSNSLLTIGAFLAAAYKIIPGMVRIINVTGQMRSYAFAIADLAQAVPANAHSKENTPLAPLTSIELNNISFSYKEKNEVLTGLNITLRPADFLCITGESGKGKTTLVHLLLGFLEADRGEIKINGGETKGNEVKNWWPRIAFTRQQGFLIHDTLERNITLEETATDDERLQQAIHLSGLDTLISQSKEGIHKVIMENGRNISGGQQQRIAIARALYKNADLLVLDEPFNELDEQSEILLLQRMQKLATEGKMIVLVTHNKNALAYSNKSLSLDL